MLIPCACGCGTLIDPIDNQRRQRQFIRGHSSRTPMHRQRAAIVMSATMTGRRPSEAALTGAQTKNAKSQRQETRNLRGLNTAIGTAAAVAAARNPDVVARRTATRKANGWFSEAAIERRRTPKARAIRSQAGKGWKPSSSMLAASVTPEAKAKQKANLSAVKKGKPLPTTTLAAAHTLEAKEKRIGTRLKNQHRDIEETIARWGDVDLSILI